MDSCRWVLCYVISVRVCKLNRFGRAELKANSSSLLKSRSAEGKFRRDPVSHILMFPCNVPVISRQTRHNFWEELKLHQLGDSMILACHWKLWSDKQKERKLQTRASLVFWNMEREEKCYLTFAYSPSERRSWRLTVRVTVNAMKLHHKWQNNSPCNRKMDCINIL